MKRSTRPQPKLLVLVILLALVAGLVFKHQAITDWLALRNYTPPTVVAQLANEDTMTAAARHLFYVNHPDITSGSAFSSHCPAGSEKTVVLGCYVGNDSGIYLYKVTDPRLMGVEQVTAAHETLHAAYRRLSSGERTKVNAMLNDFYEHGLTDQRVKDTIAAYKKSEPNDVLNEMHSVFGTEVANLPQPLENYYKRYFTDRTKITDYTATYQAEFTGRQAQVAQYDAQLKTLKQQVDANQKTLTQQKTALEAQNQQLQTERSSGQLVAYNAGVASYNAAVGKYNNLVQTTKQLINQYNELVSQRNAVAIEEQQLVQAISGEPATAASK